MPRPVGISSKISSVPVASQAARTSVQKPGGGISGAHVLEATALWLQTMVVLTAGDTVELQGNFRAADGYFAADQTSFWGTKVG